MKSFNKRRRANILSTPNLSGPTKQPWKEPNRMVQANSFAMSKDHRYFVVNFNTVDMLSSITGIIEVPLPNNWTMSTLDKYKESTNPKRAH